MNSASVFLTALLCALILTPLVIRFAHRFRILDIPKPNKIHKKPVALLGGLAVYASICISVGVFGVFGEQAIGLFAVMTTLMMLGLIDDLKNLRPSTRLMVELLTALFIIFGLDIKIHFLADYPLLCYSLTILWIVGVTNALNLLDHADGAAGGAGFFSGLGLFAFAYLHGDLFVAFIALALAGACLGFLRFNFNGASIFLGDTGSLLLGITLSTLALMATAHLTLSLSQVFILPLILGVPIYDTCLITGLRIYHNRPIYMPDKSHLTFRLSALGLTQTQAVLAEYGMALVFVGSALALRLLNSDFMATMILCSVISLAIALGLRLAMTSLPQQSPQGFSSPLAEPGIPLTAHARVMPQR